MREKEDVMYDILVMLGREGGEKEDVMYDILDMFLERGERRREEDRQRKNERVKFPTYYPYPRAGRFEV